MTKLPLVSCIIPSYNREELMKERALDSALRQTYWKREIIVVDDGSDKFYEHNDGWWTTHHHRNKGGSAARMTGVQMARGEYVVFIDDDNRLHQDFLIKSVKELENNPDIHAVTSYRIIQYPDHQDEAEIGQTKYPAIDWGWLIRKDVFYRIAYDEQIWGDEDADFGIQFSRAGFKYHVIPEYLQTAYVPGPEEEKTSNTYPNERRLKGLSNFLKKNLQYYEGDDRRYILRLAGRNFYKGGKRLKGLWYFYRSFFAYPSIKSFVHLFMIHLGWSIYDKYMTWEEKYAAQRR